MYSIEFVDGSNPWVGWHADSVYRWLRGFELVPKPTPDPFSVPTFTATERPRRLRTYVELKDAARDMAIDWQDVVAHQPMSYGTLAEWSDIFEELGRRYGLLREFHENAIC